jgi:Protein of unknown function (DUF1194)
MQSQTPRIPISPQQSPSDNVADRRLPARLLIAATLALTVIRPATAACPDLALVLAVDASGSIDAPEFSLQQQGYAAAFRSSAVQSALASAGRVDVALVLWGDDMMPIEVLPWHRIQSSADADNLANRVAGLPRRVTGNTGIGSGIAKALDVLATLNACQSRLMINVSGDGKESRGPRTRVGVSLASARARARDMGVTINALAITNEVADLSAWYRDQVISGPGSFVMEVSGFDTFAAAIERKLAREIAPAQVATMSGCRFRLDKAERWVLLDAPNATECTLYPTPNTDEGSAG